MAKKLEKKTRKPANGKPGAKPRKPAQSRVPQQAENIEHTIRRVVRERHRYDPDKFGLYL